MSIFLNFPIIILNGTGILILIMRGRKLPEQFILINTIGLFVVSMLLTNTSHSRPLQLMCIVAFIGTVVLYMLKKRA